MAGFRPGADVWRAAMVNAAAYPMDSDDIRRADIACKAEIEIECAIGTSTLCAGDSVDFKVFSAVTQKIDDLSRDMPRTLSFVEIFAGQAGASRKLRDAGVRAVAVERTSQRVWDDVTRVSGFIYVALSISMLHIGATAWFSPQCSTWVNCARAHTTRSTSSAWGSTDRDDVRKANCLA
eukprot:4830821-Pyramimonas_sp.AAC.1